MATPGCMSLRTQITTRNHDIFNTVCEIFNKNPHEVLLNNKIRKREYSIIRQISMTLFVLKLKSSLDTAGIYFDGKNKATVLHAIENIKDLLDTDRKFKEEVGHLFVGVTFPNKRNRKIKNRKILRESGNK